MSYSILPSFGTVFVGAKPEVLALSRQEKKQKMSRFIAFDDMKQSNGVYISGEDLFKFRDLIPEEQMAQLEKFAPGTYRFSTKPALYQNLKTQVLSVLA